MGRNRGMDYQCQRQMNLVLRSIKKLVLTDFFQLGLGTSTDMVFSPTLVESLTGVPLAGVACGGNHTLVVTVSGAVFAFGSNNHGQLGLGDLTDRRWPTQVATLRNIR